MSYLIILIVALIAYLIGSIPTGYIIVKKKTGKDIRELGSGSTGATNVKRVLGKRWFFVVMILDVIKGFVPVCLAKYYMHNPYGLFAVVAAIFVILGHSKPVFLGFRGGKSVASGIGTIIAMSPIVGALAAFIWACVTFVTRYVSVGSIVALIFATIYMAYYGKPIGYTIYCLIATIYIIYLHRENIARLLRGEENKIR